MSKLFSPLKIRSVELKNRIVMSPMCEYSSRDGFANDWHLVHLGSRAVGGTGLIMAEATAISPEGRITHSDLGIWKDEHISFLKRITDFIKTQGTTTAIQIAHAGRKASHHLPWQGGKSLPNKDAWQTWAPSPIPFSESTHVPEALDTNGIEKVIADFKSAAERALSAGFQILEIHAAHGYLIHEFLSPISNQRKDQYGGSFQNRIRLLVEIVEKLRTIWPEELPLFVRISATDWVEGGWTVEDSVALAKVLKNKGVDLIDCSSGANVPNAKIPVGPGYQVPFAEEIKKKASVLTGAVGLITSAAQAEAILVANQADLIFLARELLRNPYFSLHAAKELGADIAWPLQYERAKL